MMSKVQKGVTISQLLSSFLLSTPHSTTNVTPAEMLMNRKLRTRLDLIQPNIENTVTKAQGKSIKTHDSELQGQEEEAGHTQRTSVLFTGSTALEL